MASEKIRNPITDQLLSPANSALVVIDYQPIQVSSIRSMSREELVFNITSVAKAAVNYDLPIVHSTVNVATGRNKPPIQELQDVIGYLPTYDRTSINSWEDAEFKAAVPSGSNPAYDRRRRQCDDVAGGWVRMVSRPRSNRARRRVRGGAQAACGRQRHCVPVGAAAAQHPGGDSAKLWFLIRTGDEGAAAPPNSDAAADPCHLCAAGDNGAIPAARCFSDAERHYV